MESPKTEEKAPAAVFLDRVSRVTRGKRMNKLLDTEIEEDELFWKQDALQEEENDFNYEQEPEVADEFDSDFEDDESEPDDEDDNEAVERPQPKKRLMFPGKTLRKMKKKKKKKEEKVLSNLDGSSKDEDSSQQPTTPANQDAPDEAEGERTVRKSTRTSVIVRQAERDAIRAAMQAVTKPIKRKKEGEEKRMSQEEMLLEAAQTEIMNLRNLERVLAREEEVKKRAIVHKAVYEGPQIRYYSKDGLTHLEFRGLSFQSELCSSAPPYPEKAVCAVTGLPAKYRDPKTGLPYATKEAFKIIRERFVHEIKPPTLGRTGNDANFELDMGSLFDSLNGKGFSRKRKRSQKCNNRSRIIRIPYLFNLGRSPSIEIEDSE